MLPFFAALLAVGLATPLYRKVQMSHLLDSIENGGLGLSNEVLGPLVAGAGGTGVVLGSLAAVIVSARSTTGTSPRLLGMVAVVPPILLVVASVPLLGLLMVITGVAVGWDPLCLVLGNDS